MIAFEGRGLRPGQVFAYTVHWRAVWEAWPLAAVEWVDSRLAASRDEARTVAIAQVNRFTTVTEPEEVVVFAIHPVLVPPTESKRAR